MAADGEGMDQERACVAVRDIIQDLPRDLLGIGGPGDVDGSRLDHQYIESTTKKKYNIETCITSAYELT